MRLVCTTYNILDGGTGRADPLAEVLLAQRADVVVLVEAVDAEVVDRLARRLGMDYVTGAGPTDAAVVLTRHTVVSSVNHSGLAGALAAGGSGGGDVPRGMLEVWLEVGGVEVGVFAVHLTARATVAAEWVRLREMEAVLARAAGARAAGRPHVIAGDLNANSPHQVIELQRCKPATQEAAREQGGLIPRHVIERVEAAGYVDALLAVDEQAGRFAGTFTTQYPGQRIDYVFAFGLTPVAGRIETHRLATYASDHYPVTVTLEK